MAIGRALVTNLRTRSLAEGGSTITQQLAKNELFTQEKQLTRKAAEVFAAFALERTYTKRQEVLEMYVDTIFLAAATMASMMRRKDILAVIQPAGGLAGGDAGGAA